MSSPGALLSIFKKDRGDFPGASVDKNPPANAGDIGLIPDLGRSYRLRGSKCYVPQLLSLCSRAWEPELPKPLHPLASDPPPEKPLQGEAWQQQLETLAPTREKPKSNENPMQR